MGEAFLHFIWKFQHFNKVALKTTAGEELNIIRQGMFNTDAGPDFSNAKIIIDGIEWFGHVEIHTKASDWHRHNHADNPAYENVILHVVFDNDQPINRKDNTWIPTLDISQRLDFNLYGNYKNLVSSISPVPCSYKLPSLTDQVKISTLDKALIQRLESKGRLVIELLKENNGDWDETAYQLLAKNFGFKINSEAFLDLSQALPYKFLKKHADQLTQVEAMLFGVAGFLRLNDSDDYSDLLKREYSFLAHKYQLQDKELNLSKWKFLRLRPANFPTIRIAQFAATIASVKNLFSYLLEIKNFKDAEMLFSVKPSLYWQDHYNFNKKDAFKNDGIGDSSIENLIINTVCPILAAYRMETDDYKYLEQAITLLESTKAESNRITKLFSGKAFNIKTAFDSQAVIELHNNFCIPRKCLDCSIGTSIIKT
jgi:hypothetical protein